MVHASSWGGTCVIGWLYRNTAAAAKQTISQQPTCARRPALYNDIMGTTEKSICCISGPEHIFFVSILFDFRGHTIYTTHGLCDIRPHLDRANYPSSVMSDLQPARARQTKPAAVDNIYSNTLWLGEIRREGISFVTYMILLFL